MNNLLKNKWRESPVYKTEHSCLGDVQLHIMDIEEDINTIYEWTQMDYAKYWDAIGKSEEEVRKEYNDIISSRDHMAFIGRINKKLSFLFECYDPTNDPISTHYKVKKGDIGLHILMAPPPVKPIKNFTFYVFVIVLSFMFSHSDINRIVVEPDVNNKKIHALNKRAGFVYVNKINLDNKVAYLAFCTRTNFTTL